MFAANVDPKKIHPDLVRVLEAASQAHQPFEVCYGVRTLAAEQEAVATHHSQTLHSRHLPDARYGGVAMAADVVALDGGHLDWAPGHELAIFGAIATEVLAAAARLGIRVQWGGQPVGAWRDGVVSDFRDWGHFQLDPSAYPA